ncbi:hypothetical protein QAD02_006566 [Eretmocerus hayati]|uniref:Uncharacterized protein n=1 Tax=Eretmocerus hayati TaxID=131215 RepID=A0ACC2N1J1_9HYME|nr:hypothetical protein QAD02_006566 [Eretmocerus hayati]
MEVILQTGFEKITHSISFQPESMPKGRKLVESGHVIRVEEFVKDGLILMIKSKVIRQTSVTKPPYSTSLKLDANRRVTGTSCDCFYKESGRSKHVAALIYYINNEESLSKTRYEQAWGIPSISQLVSEKYSKGAWLSQMFGYAAEPPQSTQRGTSLNIDSLLNEVDSSSLFQILSMMNRCQSRSTVEPPPEVNTVILIYTDNVSCTPIDNECGVCFDNFMHSCSEYPVYQKKYCLKDPLQEFYDSHVALSLYEMREIFCNTVKQSECDEWHDVRVKRLPASSKVHRIKVRTKKITEESLVLKLLWSKKVDNAATRYGLMNESVAIRLHEELYNCEVKRIHQNLYYCYCSTYSSLSSTSPQKDHIVMSKEAERLTNA